MSTNLLHNKAKILVEALPYIRAFYGKTVVIKYGGAAMTDAKLKVQFAEDVVLMKYVGMNPIIVHGGGPQISEMMRKLGKEPKFVKGVRVTDRETMEIVEMVLVGSINKEIVTLIHQQGGRGVGLSGTDGALIQARPLKGEEGEAMSHVGKIEEINPEILKTLDAGWFIPVISPIGTDAKGNSYNINADSVSGAVATAISAEKLIILTDVPGILDESGSLIPTLSRKEVQRLIKKGVINSGMLPKVEAALTSVERGIRKAHIIDGRVPHALLLELFTDQGIGTEIIA